MVQTARLRNVDIFRGLPDEELEIVAGFYREESLPEGLALCEKGARADKLFIREVVPSRLKAFVDYY